MKLEEFTKALETKNYEIVQDTSCCCTIEWDIDRDGVLHYSASGDDCWVAKELIIDGLCVLSFEAGDDLVVVDQELKDALPCDIVNFLQDHESDEVLKEIDIDDDEINEEHEAKVREAFINFISREEFTVYAYHPRGFGNEYNLYLLHPNGDESEIPEDAQQVDIEDVVDYYLMNDDGTIMCRIDVTCV